MKLVRASPLFEIEIFSTLMMILNKIALFEIEYLHTIIVIDSAGFILKPLIKTLESEGNLNLETFS